MLGMICYVFGLHLLGWFDCCVAFTGFCLRGLLWFGFYGRGIGWYILGFLGGLCRFLWV